jgi:hypothetical protein
MVQNVQPLRSVQDDLNGLNVLNELNGSSRGSFRLHLRSRRTGSMANPKLSDATRRAVRITANLRTFSLQKDVRLVPFCPFMCNLSHLDVQAKFGQLIA